MSEAEFVQEPEDWQAEQIEKISLYALHAAYQRIINLGAAGEETVEKNKFGDTALRADIEAEKAIIKIFESKDLPVKMLSEEHGEQDFGENQQFLAVLDGIDGSGWYKKDRENGRYGTMFAIFNGTDPRYDDYIFCGIVEHATSRLFYATKGNGSFFIDLLTGEKQKITTSGQTVLDKEQITIKVDEEPNNAWFPLIQNFFLAKLSGYKRPHLAATSAHYVDLVSGECGLVLECTRKGNLELGVGFGLVKEAGGVIVDLSGKDIGDRKFSSFGQDTYVAFIAAATNKLAQETVTFLQK